MDSLSSLPLPSLEPYLLGAPGDDDDDAEQELWTLTARIERFTTDDAKDGTSNDDDDIVHTFIGLSTRGR